MGGDDNRRMNTTHALNGIARLGYLGCIRVSGPDALRFLNSQLTRDFSRIDSGRARLTGFCSAKGRLQASFIGWSESDTEVLLVCSADLLAQTLKRLSMFVLRLQCRLSDASQDVSLFGAAGVPADDLIAGCSVWDARVTENGMAIRLPDAPGCSLCLWVPANDAARTVAADNGMTSDAWRWMQLLSGVPTIEAATVDLFVPQMINFELIGGVDFQKGCYPGQEVVARSQYRGTLKRRMFLFDCDVVAAAGQEVYVDTDPLQPAGVVVNAASVPAGAGTGSTLLVELKLAALDANGVHLGQLIGPRLRRRDLPYAVVPSAV